MCFKLSSLHIHVYTIYLFSLYSMQEVALVSLANVLYRMGHDSDATAVMQHSLEVRHTI